MLTKYDEKIRKFRDWDVDMYRGTYEGNGREALVMVAADTVNNVAEGLMPGEPIATCTVNLPHQTAQEGQTFIKSWSENKGMFDWLRDEGIVSFCSREVSAGMASAEVVRVLEPTESLNAYQRAGHPDRYAYLQQVAEDHGVEFQTVARLADLLGPNEDFDGLLATLDDLIEEDNIQ